ncbi:hypothetical protein [Caldilinea sp.]|uniref:hypothetical protein n=1 Tax=Caldilinea sp. TaxID=2293560 RepID=UPI002BB51FE0|nr:hypothetical protein [Caldilinea sp.]HRA65457.1 hypothetical protein [Caldilinea sp.]
MIDLDHPVVKRCIDGTRAEFEGRRADAHALYQQAWDAAQDDYAACIAAHYLARFQATPDAIFAWNQEALRRAEAVDDARVAAFYPSLYLSMGYAYEQIGDQAGAQHYYALAASLGYAHQAGAAPRGRG